MINKKRLFGNKNGMKGKCKHCTKTLSRAVVCLLEHRLLTHSTKRTELLSLGKASPPPAECHGHLYLSLATGTQNKDPRDLTSRGEPDGARDNPSPGNAVLRVRVPRAAPRTPTTGSVRETANWGPGPPARSASRRRSPRAANPEAENSNSFLKMSRDTGISVRVSLRVTPYTSSPPSLVRTDLPRSARPRDPDAPPPKRLPTGSRETTHARDAGHAHPHSSGSLNPARPKFHSESAFRA